MGESSAGVMKRVAHVTPGQLAHVAEVAVTQRHEVAAQVAAEYLGEERHDPYQPSPSHQLSGIYK